MKGTLAIVALVAALLVVAGCVPKGTPFPSTTGTDKDVNAIETDVTEVGSISADLDTSDLDTLDQELSEVESLEVQ
ncbi:MAG: hypothetical protein QXT19_03100 [Candidatus Woesearchaeota archaeon]